MRSNVDPHKIEELMKVLGREARGSGCIYFTGGASALLIGWRSSTVDIDIRLDPEPPGIFQALAKLKQQLDINIELASPQDFLPPLPDGVTEASSLEGKVKSRFIITILHLKLFLSYLGDITVILMMFKLCTNRNYFL
jgi:hypothetical protein